MRSAVIKICSEILLSINHRLSVDDSVVNINADKKRIFMTHNIFYLTLCVSTVTCAIGADLQWNTRMYFMHYGPILEFVSAW